MLKEYSDYAWCESQSRYVDSVLCDFAGNRCADCNCQKVEKEGEGKE